MKNTVGKSFFAYLLMLVGVVAGVLCIFLAILIFNKGEDIFGIGVRYIDVKYNDTTRDCNYNGTKTAIKTLHDSNRIQGISFDSGSTDLLIEVDQSSYSMYIETYAKLTGFSKQETNQFSITVDYNNSTNMLDVKIVEPKLAVGFATYSRAKIVVPNSTYLQNYTIKSKTISGSIKLGDSIQNITTVSNINIESNNGKISLGEYLSLQTGNCTINATSSSVEIYSNVTNRLNIQTEKSKVKIGNIDGDLSINAKFAEIKCNRILGNVRYSSENGYFDAKFIGGEIDASEETTISNISIGEICGSVNLPLAEQSNITIDKYSPISSLDECRIRTTSGQVIIKDSTGRLIDIETVSGSICVNQNNELARTILKSKTGVINAKFIGVGNASLVSEKATINVQIATDKEIVFNYNTGKNITVSWETEPRTEKVDTILISGATSASSNIINATTGGSIKLANGYIA